jgi:hypothetical protein
MAKRLPVTRPPAPRVIHYVDPAAQTIPAELVYPLNPAQLAARKRRDLARYQQWRAEQDAIAERDRKARRFWLGFGAVLALALLAGIAVVGWLIWTFLTGLGYGVLAVPALILAVAALGVGGHRCITVVQHWH